MLRRGAILALLSRWQTSAQFCELTRVFYVVTDQHLYLEAERRRAGLLVNCGPLPVARPERSQQLQRLLAFLSEQVAERCRFKLIGRAWLVQPDGWHPGLIFVQNPAEPLPEWRLNSDQMGDDVRH